jgi:outer membrane protein OmpA-like peptidoglycan-associated protein
MTTLINGRTPEQHAAWNRWHAIIAALLALLVLILWLSGKGPGFATATGSCCGVAVPVAAAPAVAPAVPVDTDGDGVVDANDACPGTPAGTAVDAKGCELAAAAPAAEATVAAPVAPIPAANLYFEVDKFDVPADTDGKLQPIIEYLKANPSAAAVISGYHDPTGNQAHNIELAKNRAFAVRDYLEKSGVGEARIDMAKPIETTGSGDLQQARRVEVSVRP